MQIRARPSAEQVACLLSRDIAFIWCYFWIVTVPRFQKRSRCYATNSQLTKLLKLLMMTTTALSSADHGHVTSPSAPSMLRVTQRSNIVVDLTWGQGHLLQGQSSLKVVQGHSKDPLTLLPLLLHLVTMTCLYALIIVDRHHCLSLSPPVCLHRH